MANQSVQIIKDNLNLVWKERDTHKRLKAIEKIYNPDANLYHVGNKITGLEAINNSITAILKNSPPDFDFTLLQPVEINNDIGRAVWGVGPTGKTPLDTGMDIVVFENSKIKSLYVFLD